MSDQAFPAGQPEQVLSTLTAFPAIIHDEKENVLRAQPGMSLRSYFAGQALAGLLACSETEGTTEKFADSAVLFADALIERLKK
jgi:hypothetical protein